MSDQQQSDAIEFEQSFLGEVDRTRALVMEFTHKAIEKDPDAYPFVLEMLNTVLHAGIDADTIGGSEPNTLRGIAKEIKAVLIARDPHSLKFITVV
jgi:hypothetical protein